MIFSLIGMSGTGKSFWSKKLVEEEGFLRICCDDLIEERLTERLAARGIRAVASWMGFPYDERYPENEALYLALEREVMLESLQNLPKDSHKNLVIDTTGSVIYTGHDVCCALKQATKVVNLQVPVSLEQRFLDKYLNKPKPVVWNGHFGRKAGETHEEAIRRCYPLLLRSRLESYAQLADISIGADVFLNREQTAADFLRSFY